MLEFRPYDIAHIQRSFDFLLETFCISFGSDKVQWPNNLGSYHFEKYKADIERLLLNKEYFFFSVFRDSQLIGQVELKKLKDSIGYVSFFYLIPEYRNQGFGRELIEFSMRELKRNDCHKARLTVSELNVAALKFYAKNGWKSLGPDPSRPLGITMEKEID